MTTQLPSKERLEEIANWNQRHDPVDYDEARAMARALLAAYEQPVAYAVFANNGNIRIWSTDKAVCDGVGDTTPLYTHPAPSIPAMIPDEMLEFHLRSQKNLSKGGNRDAWSLAPLLTELQQYRKAAKR